MCWFCHWGWPKAVHEIYRRAVAELGYEDPMEFGPGSIVWGDCNFDFAQDCLNRFDKWVESHDGYFSSDTLEIVKRSLEELSAYWNDNNDPRPSDDVDVDNAPDRYPPRAGIEMIDDHSRRMVIRGMFANEAR